MKYWIGLNIISNNPGLLNAVENAIPQRLDSKLWNGDYHVNRGYDISGITSITASIFFNDFNERANFKASLGAINGFLHTALPGSFLKMSKCYHDEISNKPDDLEFIEEIV